LPFELKQIKRRDKFVGLDSPLEAMFAHAAQQAQWLQLTQCKRSWKWQKIQKTASAGVKTEECIFDIRNESWRAKY
jgi:hypothetical protein